MLNCKCTATENYLTMTIINTQVPLNFKRRYSVFIPMMEKLMHDLVRYGKGGTYGAKFKDSVTLKFVFKPEHPDPCLNDANNPSTIFME